MSTKEYGYGVGWKTRNLVDESVIVATRIPDLEVSGILVEYFESTESIAVRSFSMTLRNEDGTKDVVDSGDFIVMKRDSWLTIRVRKAKKEMNR